MADVISDGKVKVTWVTALANPSTPTTAELAGGVDLEGFITPDGLAVEIGDDEVDTSSLNSTFSATRAGRGTVSIEVTFKDQGKGNAPWTTFSDRPAGFMVIRRNVDSATAYATSDDVEVYAATAGDPQIEAPAANEMSKFMVAFFASSDPILAASVA